MQQIGSSDDLPFCCKTGGSSVFFDHPPVRADALAAHRGRDAGAQGGRLLPCRARSSCVARPATSATAFLRTSLNYRLTDRWEKSRKVLNDGVAALFGSHDVQQGSPLRRAQRLWMRVDRLRKNVTFRREEQANFALLFSAPRSKLAHGKTRLSEIL